VKNKCEKFPEVSLLDF